MFKKLLMITLIAVFVLGIRAQTTQFTYQGSLKDGATPANGNYDFQFWLYDAVSGGSPLGSGIGFSSVAVTNGVFSVKLDFGSQFPGANRFLEIRVRQTGQPTYTFLTPRQPVDSSPYSVKSLNTSQLGGLAANQFLQNTTGTPQPFNFNITGSGLISGSLGLGTLSPQTKLEVFTPTSNYGFSHTDGTTRLGSFVGPGGFGTAAGWLGTVSNHPMFFFTNNGAPQMSIGTNGNVGIGTSTAVSDIAKLRVDGGTFTGLYASSSTGFAGYFDGVVTTSGNLGVGFVTGSPSDRLTVKTATTNYGLVHTDGTVSVGTFVGGSTGGGWFGTKSNHPLSFFTNNGTASISIDTAGLVYFPVMASQGGAPLCRNGPALAFCSSSLRYKTNIAQFSEGMSFINKLRPISYDWKKDGEKDIGFGAEDIEKIDPRFVTYNYEGQVEGVKYDRLSVAFVNAFKEQQTQIEVQQKQIESFEKQSQLQQKQLEVLTKALCSLKPDLEVCKQQEQ